MEALFRIAQKGEQLIYPSMDGWMNSVAYLCSSIIQALKGMKR